MNKPQKRTFLLSFFMLALSVALIAAAPKREFYEIKMYHLKDKTQEAAVEAFLKDAYIPALHRAGIKDVGVFKPVPSDTMSGKLIYVFTPLSSLDQLLTLPKLLDKDSKYLEAGKDYLNAPFKNPPYVRIETTILQAFTSMPVHTKPKLSAPKSERVYEMRSYEGHTERRYQNKVKMFNDGGEIPLFVRLGFNAVFYGEVIAGSHQPNLMYMTTFENKADRDAHWKSFSDDAEWNKLKVNPEYQNNVSKNTSFYMYPTEYSDI